MLPSVTPSEFAILQTRYRRLPRADDALRSLIHVEQRSIAAELNCPVAMIVGTADVGTYDLMRAARPLFKKASMVEFDGVGHAPFLEDPRRYESSMLEFLQGL